MRLLATLPIAVAVVLALGATPPQADTGEDVRQACARRIGSPEGCWAYLEPVALANPATVCLSNGPSTIDPVVLNWIRGEINDWPMGMIYQFPTAESLASYLLLHYPC